MSAALAVAAKVKEGAAVASPAWTVKRCKRCRKRRLIWAGASTCGSCDEILRRAADGLCVAKLHHGPGHQSSTFCEHRAEGHPQRRGRKVHRARYGSFERLAEWYGMKKFTGYFDDPPGVSW